jgi:uncharacterized protein YndB with AHSA1/START domain
VKWELTTGRARIMAPPALVWQWVSEPRGWIAWNPKIEEVIPFSADAPGPGWRCRLAYRMRKKRTQLADAELVEFVPNEKLACRTTGGDLKPGGWILETYRLYADEDTTVLTHTVDLEHSKMPYVSRVAVVFLTNLFNSNGSLGHVRNLKALMEDGVPPPFSKG